jgi:hypothetical protein
MITLSDYFTRHGARLDQRFRGDLTEEIVRNAEVLLVRVNSLVAHFLIVHPEARCHVSSGWRPPFVNEAVGGTTNSAHLTGQAVDLLDPGDCLDAWLDDVLLAEHKLWREHPSHTPGWVHLQSRPASVRSFMP